MVNHYFPPRAPKRNYIAKEAVSAGLQTRARSRSERLGKQSDALTTNPRLCVKTMLFAACVWDAVVEYDPVQCVNRLDCVDSPMALEGCKRPFPDDIVEIFRVTIIEDHQWLDVSRQ